MLVLRTSSRIVSLKQNQPMKTHTRQTLTCAANARKRKRQQGYQAWSSRDAIAQRSPPSLNKSERAGTLSGAVSISQQRHWSISSATTYVWGSHSTTDSQACSSAFELRLSACAPLYDSHTSCCHILPCPRGCRPTLGS